MLLRAGEREAVSCKQAGTVMGIECRPGCKVTEAEQRGGAGWQPSITTGVTGMPTLSWHVLVRLLPWESVLEARIIFIFKRYLPIPPSLPLLPPSVASPQRFHRCQADVLQCMIGAGIAYSPASWRARELSSPKPPTDNHQWEIAPKIPRMLGAAAHCNTHRRAAERLVA